MGEITDELRAEITRRRELMGISQAEAARRANIAQQQWQRIESGPSKSSKFLSEVLALVGLLPTVESSGFVPPLAALEVARKPLTENEADLRVLEVRLGNGGIGVLSSEHEVFVKRPHTLVGVKGGFGLYVPDQRMSPAYRAGDIVHVHPSAPIRRDDDVVLISTEKGYLGNCLIRSIKNFDADRWQLLCYSPQPGEPTLSWVEKVDWPRCLRIVASYKAG